MADPANRGPGPLPERWLRCPRKAHDVLVKFLAFKAPLDERFDAQVPLAYRFTPTMLFEYAQSRRLRLGLWIDLTRTDRFYDREQVKANGCRYVKIPCHGHEGAPNREQTRTFIELCNMFVAKDPLSVIGVHCTHGFNRTGFLIVAFLVEQFDYSVESAIREFANIRPPGIYKEAYIRELYARYYNDDDDNVAAVVQGPLPVPALPDWCYEQGDESEDEASVTGADEVDGQCLSSSRTPNRAGGRNSGGGGNSKRRSSGRIVENPIFMEGVPGIEPVTDRDAVLRVRERIRQLTGSSFDSFLGSQPVSMDRRNIRLLAEKPYRVSWKADGTRYMMLIAGAGEVYFIDRDNSVFHVTGNLQFFSRQDDAAAAAAASATRDAAATDATQQQQSSSSSSSPPPPPAPHLTKTLLDGEMVIDEYQGTKIPRYLIYDVVVLAGNRIGEQPFHPNRYRAIEKEIIEPRVDAMKSGRIVKELEPFSVRVKQFYELYFASHLLGEKFARQLTHAPDGLIFQPSVEPYVYGTSPLVLKWKPQSMNSIDFRLQVNHVRREGCLPEYVGDLLTGSGRVFDRIKCDRQLRTLHGKIVECKRENNRWVFMRERTDKSFPNSDRTADAVLESIKAPVTQPMLLEFIQKHGYKETMPPPMGPPPEKKRRNF